MPLVIFSRQVLPSIFPITVFIRDDGNRIAIHCLCLVNMLIESKCNTLRQFRLGRLLPIHIQPLLGGSNRGGQRLVVDGLHHTLTKGNECDLVPIHFCFR